MGSEVKYHLFSKLSEDTLCQCVYPYISRSQPRELLADIEQHSTSVTDLYSVYDMPIEQNTLYHDLLSFINKRSVSFIQIYPGHENILRRHTMLKNYSASKLLKFYTQCFSVNKMKNVQTKCGVLWGLFTDKERDIIINRRIRILHSQL